MLGGLCFQGYEPLDGGRGIGAATYGAVVAEQVGVDVRAYGSREFGCEPGGARGGIAYEGNAGAEHALAQGVCDFKRLAEERAGAGDGLVGVDAAVAVGARAQQAGVEACFN